MLQNSCFANLYHCCKIHYNFDIFLCDLSAWRYAATHSQSLSTINPNSITAIHEQLSAVCTTSQVLCEAPAQVLGIHKGSISGGPFNLIKVDLLLIEVMPSLTEIFKFIGQKNDAPPSSVIHDEF